MLRKGLAAVVLLLLSSCSAVRYVQDGEYKLMRNSIKLESIVESEKRNIKKLYPEDYIQQRPNSRFLGIGLKTAFYNATDTAKNDGWHRFWRDKVGEKPVILDMSKVEESKQEIELCLSSNGYFNSTVEDTVITKGKKAWVRYDVLANKPYKLRNLSYQVDDKFLEPIVYEDSAATLLKPGHVFSVNEFEKERTRISDNLRNRGFYGFGVNYISYYVDSTVGDHQFDVKVNIRRYMKHIDADGREIHENHPVYRVSSVVVETFNDTEKAVGGAYDSIVMDGVVIKYRDKLKFRPDILLNAVRMSPNEFYNQKSMEKTQANLRTLGLNANILFTPRESEIDDSITITRADVKGQQPTTTQHELSCVIQCNPLTAKSVSADFEASTTSQYFSLALLLGYQNRNAFKGGEQLNVGFRGAYEFMWQQGKKNSYELGLTASITAPRFWASISADKAAYFNKPSSKVSVSFSTQRRPDYSRVVIGGSFGYSWRVGNLSSVTINPVDLYLVSVPRIDSTFLASIENPYLRNSYTNQLLPGGSVSYVYNNNPNINHDNFSIKLSADYSGNSMRLISKLFLQEQHETLEGGETDDYYKILGIRYAQYARLGFEMTGRKNAGVASQFAWRFLIAGGYAYGNTQSLPFERMYFAGGANSMRGWQMRTLGPGGVQIDSLGVYPNQLGDFKLEANFEYRAHLFLGLSGSIFFDIGNVWVNSKGETRQEARFNFNNFYRQLGFNTGIGFRYNIADMMVLRLDWGWKLHNPNMPEGSRWFHNLGISDTAIHFAIGLPF